MKRVFSLGIAICIVLCMVSACHSTKTEENNVTTQLSQPQLAPLTFRSFEEYEQYEQKAKSNATGYYIPASVPENSELLRITKRDGVYVSVTYRVPIDSSLADRLSGYNLERMQTLTCCYYLFEDGNIALQNSFIPSGFNPIEYHGKTYYYMEEYAIDTAENLQIGHEIVFLENGQLIYMHLPAPDTFENMMKYADVVMVKLP